MKTTIELTEEKFQEIYSNEEFRNQVAFASNCMDKYEKHVNYKTNSYPVEYIVSEDQIKKASEERERAKKEKISNMKAGELVFVGMGITYKECFPGDVCNHRIRTEFKNKTGHHYFVEILSSERKYFCFDYSIDRDLEKEYYIKIREAYNKRAECERGTEAYIECDNDIMKYSEEPYNYAFNLGHNRINLDYTLDNILKIINETFDCDYKTASVDQYTLRCDDFICYC